MWGDYGDIIYISKFSLAETIPKAWNYEAHVYDSENNLVFNGRLDDEEQNELLGPYGLTIVGIGGYRYFKNTEYEHVYFEGGQKQPEIQEESHGNQKIIFIIK